MENLEGMDKKYLVLKREDIRNHLIHERQMQIAEAAELIEQWRAGEGKTPNTYLVINTDEPYASEIVEILKRHGHWG